MNNQKGPVTHVAIQSTKGDDVKTMKTDIAIVLLQVLDPECLPKVHVQTSWIRAYEAT